MPHSRRLRNVAVLLVLTAVLTSALWLFAAPPAAACSCEEMSGWAIERADAAMSGTVVAMSSIPSEWQGQDRFVATVEVTTDLKANLADEIYLTSEKDDGGNCGVTWRTGSEIAAAIYESDGVLRSDGCSLIPPPLLDSWQPAITTGGIATLLIGGDEPNRLVAYSESGTPIAYAFEPGRVQALSICPGGETVLEIVNERDNATTIEARSLATFEVTSSVPAIVDGEPLTLWDVRCDSPDGSAALTNGYVLSGGTLAASSEPLAPDTFDPQTFWPQLIGENTAPITGESWMWRAAELETPVTIQATRATAELTQLGSGEAFGLDQEPEDGGINNSLIWILGLGGVAIGIGAAMFRGRRT